MGSEKPPGGRQKTLTRIGVALLMFCVEVAVLALLWIGGAGLDLVASTAFMIAAVATSVIVLRGATRIGNRLVFRPEKRRLIPVATGTWTLASLGLVVVYLRSFFR